MESVIGVMKARARSVSRWQDIVRENFLPLEFAIPAGRDFSAAVMARPLGDAQLACISGGAQRVIRTSMLAGRSERGYYKLFWQLAGRSRVSQDGRVGDVRAGDWAYYDTARPYEVDIEAGSRFAVMLLPRERCAGWSGKATGTALPACGQARAAVASVLAVLADDNAYDGLAAESVTASIGGLMRAALAGRVVGEAQRTSNERHTAERYQLACRYIGNHLDDPALSPESVAAALNVSRRTLYASFAENGHSPFALIQRLRLEQCRRLLADPFTVDRSITRIALDQGFNDLTHFSRLFKHAYGLSPRGYRKRAIG